MYHLKHQILRAIRSFVVLATQNIHHVIIIKHACATATSNIQALLGLKPEQTVVLGHENEADALRLLVEEVAKSHHLG